MSSTTPLTDAINALTTYANEVTGKSDTTLSDAVESLVDGYGGGGGSGITGLTYYGTTSVFRQGQYAQPTFPVVANTGMILICPDTVSGGVVLFTASFSSDATKYDYGAISRGRRVFANRNYGVTEGATEITPSRYSVFEKWTEDHTITNVPVYLIDTQ